MKSVQTVYNSTSQTVLTTGSTLQLLGNKCTNCGCSITTNSNSFTINNSGIYRFSSDVTFTPTAAGTAVIQLYKNGIALPCAIATVTVAESTTYTEHIETILSVPVCCMLKPEFSIRITGVDGAVNNVGANVSRLN